MVERKEKIFVYFFDDFDVRSTQKFTSEAFEYHFCGAFKSKTLLAWAMIQNKRPPHRNINDGYRKSKRTQEKMRPFKVSTIHPIHRRNLIESAFCGSFLWFVFYVCACMCMFALEWFDFIQIFWYDDWAKKKERLCARRHLILFRNSFSSLQHKPGNAMW